jgi:cytochrome b561
MTIMPEGPPRSAAIRVIHWGTALLVLSAWVIGSAMEEVPRGAERDLAMQIHASLGVLVLGFAALRVAWTAVSPRPRTAGPVWQRIGAGVVHLALIGLTVVIPLSGLFDRWARGRTVTVFGGYVLPAPSSVPGGRAWGEVHEALAGVLVAVVAVHVVAALWHQFVLRDGVLARMVRG